MNSENPADIEALRNEIQTAIAAGRELSPDMDAHLADSVLERYRTEQQARAKALAPQQPAAPPATASRGPSTSIERTVMAVAGLAAVVAVLVLAPHLWWIIFFLPGLLGGWWGFRHDSWGRGRGPYGGSRRDLRDGRHQDRIQSMRAELGQLPDGSIHYD
ncbi:MAG TPA: hypothetical protein VGN32_03765 [Ktedonobacterales bacterium]|jgi:hypothetical protein|nr:hypothetical protein [Ktedonobacterales bacterium]